MSIAPPFADVYNFVGKAHASTVNWSVNTSPESNGKLISWTSAPPAKLNASPTFPETMDSLFLTRTVKILWKQRPHQTDSIRKVNIVLGKLVSEGQFTPSLFEPDQSRQITRLNEVIDAVALKYGKQALYLGGAHDAIKSVHAKIAFTHIPNIEVED